MAEGWRPTNVVGAPIPMYFSYELAPFPTNPDNGKNRPIYYQGKRYVDSLRMHHNYANRG